MEQHQSVNIYIYIFILLFINAALVTNVYRIVSFSVEAGRNDWSEQIQIVCSCQSIKLKKINISARKTEEISISSNKTGKKLVGFETLEPTI